MIYFFLFLFLIVLIIIIYMPIYINIKVIRKNNNDNIELKFLFLKGLIVRSIEVPFIDIINSNKGMAVEMENKMEKGSGEKDVSRRESIISFNKILDKMRKIEKFKDIIFKINKYLFDKIDIIKINWFTRIGLENAAVTGVLTGGLWSIKSYLISFITINKNIKEIDINIAPEFNSNVFETSFDCIIKFKIAYIIIAGIKGLKLKMKGGKNNGRTSNRRSYANNNGEH